MLASDDYLRNSLRPHFTSWTCLTQPYHWVISDHHLETDWKHCKEISGVSTAFALMLNGASYIRWQNSNAHDVRVIDYH